MTDKAILITTARNLQEELGKIQAWHMTTAEMSRQLTRSEAMVSAAIQDIEFVLRNNP